MNKSSFENYGPLIVYVFDNGPCGGKSKILVEAVGTILASDRHALWMPEVARTLRTSGILPIWHGGVDFQYRVAKAQKMNQEFYVEAVRAYQKRHPKSRNKAAVLVCDRGLPGFSAYFPEHRERWISDAIYKRLGTTREEALAEIGGVTHLVTAADGAPEHYVTDEIRLENPHQALELDRRTKKCYDAHPYRQIVTNRNENGEQITFEKKSEIAISGMMRRIEEIETDWLRTR